MRIDSPKMTNSNATGSFTGSFVGDGSGLTGLATASYVQFNNVDGLTSFSSSVQSRVTDLESFSSSLDATYATDAQVATAVSSLNAATSSYALQANISGAFVAPSSSFSTRVTDLEAYSSSLDNFFATDAQLSAVSGAAASDIAGLLVDSGSFSTRVTDLEAYSSSLDSVFATDAELNASSSALISGYTSADTALSASIGFDIEDIIDGTQIVTSASYALTASYADSFTAVAVTASYLDFDLNPTAEPVEGRLVWNTDEGTLDLGLDGATLQLGQEQYWYVRNNTGQIISNGTAVYATGTLGASARITVAPFIADGSIPARFFLGVTTTDIGIDSDGFVTTFGKVRNFDTSTFNSGSVLYVSPTSAGSLTPTEPTAPNLKLPVAFSLNSTNNGTIAVRATQGVRLENGHDVDITSATDGDLLVRSASVWINTKELTGPYNIDGAVTASAFTGIFKGAFSGSAQIDHDQTTNFVSDEHVAHSSVTLTAGDGLSGGGDITTSRTFAVDATVLRTTGDNVISGSAQVDHDQTTNFVANEHIDHSTVSITAGDGLSGGGNITTSRTLSVDGTVLRTTGDNVVSSSIQVDHDATTNFVANEHIDHTTISVIAGNGLTGGGTIAANRTLNVNPGDGIQIVSDAVAVDSTVIRTSGGQSIGGTTTFTNINVNGTGSFAYINSVTGSAKIIGDAFIIVNNNTPSERYAGLAVYDSGSAGTTGSLFFDGQLNDWNYEYTEGGNTDYGTVIFGPEYSTKGSPTYPTNNRVQKGTGGHHIADSNITDTGTLITLGSNTDVNGTLDATNLAIGGNTLDQDIATLSLPASTTISTFGASLIDDTSAAAARTTLGVDAAGTDNSTDVTLNTTSYDYLSLTGQQITLGPITNDDLAGSIANSKLVNSSITINGTAVSLGGTRTLVTDDISEDGAPVNLWYTDARVKTKLNAESVVSGSATQVRSFLNVENGADVTDATNVVSSLVSATGITSGNKTTIQTNLGVDPAGTDNSTNVTLNTASHNYLTLSGQQITLGVVDISDDTNLTAGTGIDLVGDTVSVDVSDFMTNGSNNRIVTATGTDGMNAEANLTFDGTTLTVTGDANITGANTSMPGHWYSKFYTTTQNYIHLYPQGHTGNASVTDIRAWNGTAADVLRITGNSNNMTWRGHTIWNAGNDGAGSGLDADTVDSLQASQFLRSDADDTATGTITVSGKDQSFIADYDVAGSNWSGRIISKNDTTGVASFLGNYNGFPGVFAHNSALNAWNSIFINTLSTTGNGNANVYTGTLYVNGNIAWHAGNDGAGSGLDADLLDGNQSSFFADKTNAQTFNNKQTIATTGTSNSPALAIDNSSSSTFNHSIECFAANLTAGENNCIFIGKQGSTKNTGYIGYKYSAAGSNANVLTFGHWDSDNLMNLTGDGKLGIGMEDPTAKLEVYNSGSTVFSVNGSQGQLFSIEDDLTGTIFSVADISGVPILEVEDTGVVTIDDTLYVYGDITSYYSSDERLKDNITLIENANDKVMQLRGVEFDWNEKSKHEGHDIGVIAQDVEKVLPEIVKDRKNGYKGVDYEKIVALLIESNKELIRKNQDLITRIENLESKLG